MYHFLPYSSEDVWCALWGAQRVGIWHLVEWNRYAHNTFWWLQYDSLLPHIATRVWKITIDCVPSDHLLLDSAPNLGPLISRWETNKFENCWYESVRILEVLKLLFQQFLNLSNSQRDMSCPILGALSNNRWSGSTYSFKKRNKWKNRALEAKRLAELTSAWLTRTARSPGRTAGSARRRPSGCSCSPRSRRSGRTRTSRACTPRTGRRSPSADRCTHLYSPNERSKSNHIIIHQVANWTTRIDYRFEDWRKVGE